MDFLATPRRRRILFAALYLSEGAPIGFLWWALPARLRAAGVSIDDATWLLAIVVLPWALKFLWAPLVDVLRGARWGYRHWIAAAQVAMGAALLPLFRLDLGEDFSLVAVLLLLHAFAAATQDVAIDALAIAAVPSDERGRINGWMRAGMLTGRAAMGGGGLLIAAEFGDAFAVGLLLAIVWSSLVLLIGTREPRSAPLRRGRIGRRLASFRGRLSRAVATRSTWLGLVFAGTAGAAFEGTGAVASYFLGAHGFSDHEIGVIFLVPVAACTTAGALAGGFLADRANRTRTIVAAQGVVLLGVLGLAAADAFAGAPPKPLLTALLLTMYTGYGMFTASSYALFMDLTMPGIAATQFSAFMGATNGCEAWAGYTTGRLVKGLGYSGAFAMMAVASVVALLLLPGLRPARGSRTGPGREE